MSRVEHLGVPTTSHEPPSPLVRLPDGTVKQVSPLTGTVVWTVPGRAHRPFVGPSQERRPLGSQADRFCAFCPERPLDVPPEKARLVLGPDGAPTVLRDVPAEQVSATVAELRRIPNLFEILSVGYWRANHGYVVPADVVARAAAYTAAPQGRDHVLTILHRRLAADGLTDRQWDATPSEAWLERGVDLFAGTHDVVVARRHFVDGATHDDQLAGSGTLTPDEHHRYIAFTVQSLGELYGAQPFARYVAVFQNWLRPAGASFDHLHKQLVAIDEHGPRGEQVLAREDRHPGLFNEVVDHAIANRLVVAQNAHAIAVAGVGHRYPALEVYSTSRQHLPWEHAEHEVRAVSDVLHALHAATGTGVPTNEEWQHRPPDAAVPMPWHIMLKWRVSTLAGFEGGTKINVNTLDPYALRDRVVADLLPLRDAGRIAPMRIGDECAGERAPLRYRARHGVG